MRRERHAEDLLLASADDGAAGGDGEGGGGGGDGAPGGGGSGVPGGEGGAGDAGSSPATPEWLANDPDLSANPALTKFASAHDAARAYVELEKKIGQRGIPVPGDKASAEEVRQFFTQLGCPVNKEGLGEPADLQKPEGVPWDDGLVEHMREAAWAVGMTKPQWDRLYRSLMDYSVGTYTKLMDGARQVHDQSVEQLKKDWGLGYDAKQKAADEMLTYLTDGQPQAVAKAVLADGTELGNYTPFVRLLARIADEAGEGRLLPGTPAPGRATYTPAEAQKKLRELEADPEWMRAWETQGHPMHADVVRQRAELFDQIHGQRRADEGATSTGLPVTGGAIVSEG